MIFHVKTPPIHAIKTIANRWKMTIYAETTAHQPIFQIKPPFNSSCPPTEETEQIICRNFRSAAMVADLAAARDDAKDCRMERRAAAGLRHSRAP